jgi:hypothetical protein
MYKKMVNYVMSGTGNSHRAAQWVAEEAGKSGIEVKNVPIGRADPESDGIRGPETIVGMFCPTHGFTAPWGMITFALLFSSG